MSINYDKHSWAYGEEITPDKLNNVENGIRANADAINEVNNNLNNEAMKIRVANDGDLVIKDNLKNYIMPGMYSVATRYFNDDAGDITYGTLIVFTGAYGFIVQIYFVNISDEMHFRTRTERNEWSPWYNR